MFANPLMLSNLEDLFYLPCLLIKNILDLNSILKEKPKPILMVWIKWGLYVIDLSKTIHVLHAK